MVGWALVFHVATPNLIPDTIDVAQILPGVILEDRARVLPNVTLKTKTNQNNGSVNLEYECLII